MADEEKPYRLPMVGGRPKKRLSRAEFEEMVRTMGARAARDYMRDEDFFSGVGGMLIRPSRRFAVELSQRVNRTSPPYLPDDMSDKARKDREVRRATAEEVSRATGMKNGGMVKAGKVAKFKNGGCVMAGRGVRNTKVL